MAKVPQPASQVLNALTPPTAAARLWQPMQHVQRPRQHQVGSPVQAHPDWSDRSQEHRTPSWYRRLDGPGRTGRCELACNQRAVIGTMTQHQSPGFFSRHTNIYLYVPNLIGRSWEARALGAGAGIQRTGPNGRGGGVWSRVAAWLGESRQPRGQETGTVQPWRCWAQYALGPCTGQPPVGAACGPWTWAAATPCAARHDPCLFVPRCLLRPSGFTPPPPPFPWYCPGYGRVAFAAYAFAVARRSPGAMIGAYLLSFVCDELDGRAARLLGQTSTLGQVLDMVTDRVATTCLLGTLGALWPPALLPCLLLVALDIASHWFHMYASLAAGASTHKDVRSRSAVVRFYYRSRVFMGFCCVCCEVLYLALYALTWPQYRTWGVLPLPPAAAQALAHTGAFKSRSFLLSGERDGGRNSGGRGVDRGRPPDGRSLRWRWDLCEAGGGGGAADQRASCADSGACWRPTEPHSNPTPIVPCQGCRSATGRRPPGFPPRQ